MTSEPLYLHVRRLFLFTEPPFRGGGVSVRRAVTAAYPDEPLLHNHCEGGPQLPSIRYAARNGIVELVGFAAGVPLLEVLAHQVRELRVGAQVFSVRAAELADERQPFGALGEARVYRFRTPWLALNEENHRRYLKLAGAERNRLLERVLVGNLLSLSKAVGYHVAERLVANLQAFDEVACHHKGLGLVGFRALFAVNFAIPDGLGIGKLASKGFGRLEALRLPGGTPCNS